MAQTLTTKDEIIAFLNETFDDNFDHWDSKERHIWVYQASDGTGKYSHQTNLDYSIAGSIGKPVVAQTYIDPHFKVLTAEFVKTSTVQRKEHTMTHKVHKVGNTYILTTFWTFLYDSYLANMDKMRGNSSYQKAVQFTGKQNPTDEEVATQMATIVYTAFKDVDDADVKDITVEVDINPEQDKVHFEGTFKINGVEANALRWRWFIDPLDKVPGLSSHPRAGGEYVGKRKFAISSDFRVRDTFIIMSSERVRVRLFCQYLEDDGELKQVKYDQVHDFSEYLPVYDYFGLAVT